ncbi:MAG: DUF5320 domain-containing protein [bacterium]
MPGGDRTGPMGAGPMTGRGAGMCAGYDVPGYMNPAFGRGFGGGRGRGFGHGFQGGGRGWRHRYYATGLPGWARGYAYPHPFPAGYAVDPGAATTSKSAREEELTYLKDQVHHFEGVLDDIRARVNELQQQSADSSKVQEKEKK